MKRLLLSLALLCATTLVPAQVTIGSGDKPAAGALLDLKQDGTTEKGLGMPRVELINLKPTTPNELSASIGATGNWNLTEHIGLAVYNSKDDVCIAPAGLYVWDGAQWQGLGEQGIDRFAENIDPATGIGMVTDYEGNIYPTKRWTSTDGTKTSGIWMTKNLLSIRKSDGTFIDCSSGLRLNPAYYMNAYGAIVVKNVIPVGTVGNYTNAGTVVTGQSYVDYARIFGLSYTQEQAMGACPRGWHLPIDADWDLLAESMDGIKSSKAYLNIGNAMKMSTNKNFISVDSITNNWTHDGTSVTENGFNALPSGHVGSGGEQPYYFNRNAGWWSASASNSCLSLYYNTQNLHTYISGAGLYFSVRCVKD